MRIYSTPTGMFSVEEYPYTLGTGIPFGMEVVEGGSLASSGVVFGSCGEVWDLGNRFEAVIHRYSEYSIEAPFGKLGYA
jgi:hypothetical protein